MSSSLAAPLNRATAWGDRYLAFLACALLGYALMGKGFAYLGLPPLYIGEITLLAGTVVFCRSGAIVASLASLPSVALALTMSWTIVRTVPFVAVHGLDALRDSVLILYGAFAFIVIGLVLESPRRLDTVIRYYASSLVVFPLVPIGFWLTKYWGDHIPRLYGPDIPVVEIGASALGTHLAGSAVFVLIGYRKVSLPWVLVWLMALAMIGATNRGATLAALLSIGLATLVLGRFRLMLGAVASGVAVFAVLLGIEAAFVPFDEAKDSIDRPISAHQILENAKSVIGQSGQQTEGTKQWRLNWWEVILNDTFHGPSFWTGRGFGLNLGEADGFSGTEDPLHPRPPTRSPHNVHMTVLARSGVPGAVLWAFTLLAWAGMMLRWTIVARRRRHGRWSDLFLWILCYVIAIVVNATFDVTLEGPMQGIWFWCLFGLGIGAVMVYRARTEGDPPGAKP